MPPLAASLMRLVAERANYRCEYCGSPQIVTGQTFHIEHIIPVSRGGVTHSDNLAYSCPRCNLHKSDRLDAVDLETQLRTRLFDPRTDRWGDHFRWSEGFEAIEPITSIGRVTVVALDMNATVLIDARRLWVILGLLP